jgi:hypothetical protein
MGILRFKLLPRLRDLKDGLSGENALFGARRSRCCPIESPSTSNRCFSEVVLSGQALTGTGADPVPLIDNTPECSRNFIADGASRDHTITFFLARFLRCTSP